MNEMFDMGGMHLPEYLGKAKVDAEDAEAAKTAGKVAKKAVERVGPTAEAIAKEAIYKAGEHVVNKAEKDPKK
jgi:hypothetical protein